MIISTGTLLTRDLILAFEVALSTLAKTDKIAAAYEAGRALTPFIPTYAREDRDSEWWDSEAAGWELEELFNMLCEVAPEGTYFGAHEGDGACFGFWDEDISND